MRERSKRRREKKESIGGEIMTTEERICVREGKRKGEIKGRDKKRRIRRNYHGIEGRRI